MVEKALVKIESLAIQKINVERVIETLKESGLTGFNPFSFDQIRVPGAGSVGFTVPTADGPESMKFLDVIVLHSHRTRQYYTTKYDPQSPQAAPPSCVSYDGVTGQGNPGGACVRCPFGQFGKECNPGYFAYLLFPDRRMPVKLNVPRTSISLWEAYLGVVGLEGYYLNQVVTRIGLEKRKQGLGMVLTFKILYPLAEGVAEASRNYALAIAANIVYPGFGGDTSIDPTASPAAPVIYDDEDDDL
jgi:hypothetical protein